MRFQVLIEEFAYSIPEPSGKPSPVIFHKFIGTFPYFPVHETAQQLSLGNRHLAYDRLENFEQIHLQPVHIGVFLRACEIVRSQSAVHPVHDTACGARVGIHLVEVVHQTIILTPSFLTFAYAVGKYARGDYVIHKHRVPFLIDHIVHSLLFLYILRKSRRALEDYPKAGQGYFCCKFHF